MGGLSWMGRGLSIANLLARRTAAILLPQDCYLCGQPEAPDLLCVSCHGSLVRLPAARCAICALPTPLGEVCGECLAHAPRFDRTCCALVYRFPVDRLIQALKFNQRLAIADYLAARMTEADPPRGDMIMPVPVSAERLRERGFNQAVEIARPLSARLGLPLALDACVRTVDTAAQAGLPWKERRKNMRNAFACRVDLSGKHVIVVDDVMTTGATLDEIADTLKKHGAASVTNWVAARTLKT